MRLTEVPVSRRTRGDRQSPLFAGPPPPASRTDPHHHRPTMPSRLGARAPARGRFFETLRRTTEQMTPLRRWYLVLLARPGENYLDEPRRDPPPPRPRVYPGPAWPDFASACCPPGLETACHGCVLSFLGSGTGPQRPRSGQPAGSALRTNLAAEVAPGRGHARGADRRQAARHRRSDQGPAKEARRVLGQARQEQALTGAQCAFKRIPGKTYHLYRKGDGTPFFSMLSPEDWHGAPPHEFLGSYRLEPDYYLDTGQGGGSARRHRGTGAATAGHRGSGKRARVTPEPANRRCGLGPAAQE